MFVAIIITVGIVLTAGSMLRESPLEKMELMGKSLLKDPNFRLGKEWRDEKGNLLEANVKFVPRRASSVTDVSPISPPAECSTAALSSVTVNGYTVNYQFIYPGSSLTASLTSICLYMTTSLAPVDINFNPTTQTVKTASIPFPGTSGLTCEDCFAYVGTDITFTQTCALDATAVPPTATCTFEFETGGGIAYNVAVVADNPTFSAMSKLTVVAPPTSTTQYTMLFQDPSSGIYIKAAPAMDVALGGTGQIVGTGNITASFITLADLAIGVNSGNQIYQGFTQQVSINPPEIFSSKLSLSGSLSVSLEVLPTVYWEIGVSYSDGSTPVAGMGVLFNTPFTGTYTLSEFYVPARPTKPFNCNNTEVLTLEGAVTGFVANAAISGVQYTFSIPIDVQANTSVSATSGVECLTERYGTLAPSSAPVSSLATVDLSTGDLAAVIILPILFVLAVGAIIAYYVLVLRKNAALMAGQTNSSSSTTSAPASAPAGGKKSTTVTVTAEMPNSTFGTVTITD